MQQQPGPAAKPHSFCDFRAVLVATVTNVMVRPKSEFFMIWSDPDPGQTPIKVTIRDAKTCLADIARRFETRQGFSIATINLDHVVKLRRDPAFRAAYAAQTHVTADGNPIVWLSRLAGQDVSLVPGSELVEPVAALAAEAGVPVAFVGATEASLAAASQALAAGHPGLNVAMIHAPAMGFDPDGADAGEIIEKLGAAGARLVYLALGAPKQERFAARAQAHLPETGFLSIGAGLDFVSGAQTRAPAWVQAIAAEWLWRLALSPRRLAARYGACLIALPGLTLRALAERRS